MTTVKTHCPYCSLQCGMVLQATGDRPVTLQPQPDFPVNKGGLCSKGWTAAELLDHPDRLLHPLVREREGDRTSPLRPATWDEALDRIAHGIRHAQEKRRDFTVDWVHLKLNDQAQRTVLCKDPFRAYDERVERLIASM